MVKVPLGNEFATHFPFLIYLYNMYKNFNITEEEREKILNDHKKHGYKQPLNESEPKIIKLNLINEQPVANVNPKNLKFGDRGDDVKTLQQLLMNKGLLKTTSMIPTGYFGNMTNAALKKVEGKTVPFMSADNSGISGQSKVNKTSTIKPVNAVKATNPIKPVTPVKGSYNFTPRMDMELAYIKQRKLDDKPFFVYDPRQNLIYGFDKGGVLVDYSQVVDGADVQKNHSEGAFNFTIQDWCKISGYVADPAKCTAINIKTEKDCLINKDGSKIKGADWLKKSDGSFYCKRDPYYSPLQNIQSRFFPKGIYTISGLYRDAGYAGKGANVFNIQNSQGQKVVNAVHGIPNLPNRIIASAELEELLKKDIESGKVPQKYLDSIKKITNANLSFGCVGVPAKFIDNEKVKTLAEQNARLFVMGEDGKDFLVQNTVDYLNKLSSNGEQCVNPESLASTMSGNLNNSNIA